eukprot:scaffold3605_cov430-Prasinococcus_capsulatus_cf.AAC.6
MSLCWLITPPPFRRMSAVAVQWVRYCGVLGTPIPKVNHYTSRFAPRNNAKGGSNRHWSTVSTPESLHRTRPWRARGARRSTAWNLSRACQTSLRPGPASGVSRGALRSDSQSRGDSSEALVLDTLAEALADKCGVEETDTLIVCVSGGADSVALLHGLVDCNNQRGWQLRIHVLHFNHGLRPVEAGTEQVMVQSYAKQHKLPFHLRTRTAEQWPSATSGVQEHAREWRRQEAEALRRHLGAHAIVLAHHADDQTETILLKWLRGCHLSNLHGMNWKEGTFIRPLLSLKKENLLGYLDARHISWLEDSSNASDKYMRNRVRHRLIPLLHELTDGALESRISALAEQSQQLREMLDSYGTPQSRQWDEEIDVDDWMTLPRMARMDALYELMSVAGERATAFSSLKRVWYDQ